jgi:hypothetical protein
MRGACRTYCHGMRRGWIQRSVQRLGEEIVAVGFSMPTRVTMYGGKVSTVSPSKQRRTKTVKATSKEEVCRFRFQVHWSTGSKKLPLTCPNAAESLNGGCNGILTTRPGLPMRDLNCDTAIRQPPRSFCNATLRIIPRPRRTSNLPSLPSLKRTIRHCRAPFTRRPFGPWNPKKSKQPACLRSLPPSKNDRANINEREYRT